MIHKKTFSISSSTEIEKTLIYEIERDQNVKKKGFNCIFPLLFSFFIFFSFGYYFNIIPYFFPIPRLPNRAVGTYGAPKLKGSVW
jgi:hypothetical protein